MKAQPELIKINELFIKYMDKVMIALSENHQRAVKAIAIMVERKLEELENCLLRTSLNARGVQIIHEKDMTDEQIDRIQRSINTLYQILGQFCYDYGIPHETMSLKREISVKASFLWEELSDALNRKITGYRENDKIVKEKYFGYVNDMIGMANDIIYHCNEI